MKRNDSQNKNLEKIKSFSGVLAIISSIAMYFFIFGIVLVLIGILFADFANIRLWDSHQEMKVGDISLTARLVLFFLIAISGSIIVKTFYHLRRLFSLYRNGEVFTEGIVSEIRKLGYMLIFWAVSEVLWTIGIGAVIFLTDFFSSAGFTLNPLGFVMPLLIGLVVLFVSRITDEGRKLSEDISLTI